MSEISEYKINEDEESNMNINYREIEQKWYKAWHDAKIYEVEPDERPSLLVTAAFPYVDMPQHIGHLRTYSTADAYARYKRMRGFNVLFPMGFQPSGIPIMAIAKRIANNDEQLIDVLRRVHHISDEDIAKMKDPNYIANYFINVIKQGFIDSGYGIDWRREIISTEPIFSKMVEWQFFKLKEKGYLVTGVHPVGWCTNEGNPVGQHDTKGDTSVKIEEFVGIKFKDVESDVYFVCATYRPETIYGVTNLFIKKDTEYVIAQLGNIKIYLSKASFEILKYQIEIVELQKIDASILLSKKAINPITNDIVPVLPGFFVKQDVGTGIVMSVPSHAPFDYVALKKLKNEGYNIPEFEDKKIIEIEKDNAKIGLGRSIEKELQKGKAIHSNIPALAYLEILELDEKASEDLLEMATKKVYSEEARYGIMLVGKYAGKREAEARELLKKDMLNDGIAIKIYTIANDEPVYCRCGTKVIIKVVNDQWFINYGDKEWKEKTKKVFADVVKLYPEKYRHTYESLLDWLDLRAAERAQGLGTKFPFNPNHVIESLSDSTIYPMLYTFAHILRSSNISAESLKPEFFDYVVYGVGNLDEVAKNCNININIIQKCRESFDYWYKNTSRHSGSDLLANHLLMYLFNHVAIFPEKYYPKQIVTNGLVYFEGVKMSKSLGNVYPVSDGIAKFGADPLKLLEVTSADIDSDIELDLNKAIAGVYSRNEFFYNQILNLHSLDGNELTHIDYWLYSKLNKKIKNATAYMEELSLKNAYSEIYYNSYTELKKYIERGGKNQVVIREYLENVVLMLAPVMPMFAEELWHMLSNNSFVVKEKWPSYNVDMINDKIEAVEEMITNTIEDINSTIALTAKIDANKNKSVKEIKIIIADDWKLRAYNTLIEKKNMQDAIAASGVEQAKASKFLAPIMPKLKSLIKLPEIDNEYMLSAFLNAQDYIKRKFDANIVIEKESTSKSPRAYRAMPNKPSIDIIWG
jgi:leucyl-tRNA synthetase